MPALRAPKGLWEEFVERNSPVLSANEGNELLATHSLRSVQAWGNLGQRPRRALGYMLSFAYKRFDGRVPEPGPLDDEDRALLEKVEAGFETVGELYNACRFRAAPSVPSGQA
jgi:methionyl-tRNA synthetase